MFWGMFTKCYYELGVHFWSPPPRPPLPLPPNILRHVHKAFLLFGSFLLRNTHSLVPCYCGNILYRQTRMPFGLLEWGWSLRSPMEFTDIISFPLTRSLPKHKKISVINKDDLMVQISSHPYSKVLTCNALLQISQCIWRVHNKIGQAFHKIKHSLCNNMTSVSLM
jgi:hypothetical protein